ncbi:hypothetical protein LguiB_022231 [Lonicera macranthoides]
MEERRTDTENQLPANSSATETPPKAAETPPPEPISTRRRGGGNKRKASNLSSGNNSSTPSTSSFSSKRQAREKISAVPFPPIHNGPLTRARLQPNNGGGAPAIDSDVRSEGQVVAPQDSGGGGAVKVEEELRKENFEALEAKIETEYEVIRSREDNAHVVPIPSGWFSWTKVHPLEKRALPSFFNGKSKSRNPEIYVEIRNWIMNKFHTNPNTQVELKDLSELSIGELDARQEVMEFLDYWGLINYHPFPTTDSATLAADADGGTKSGLSVEKLYYFEKEQSCAPAICRTNVATPTVPSRLFSESAIAEELAGPEGPSVEYHCNSCSADCSRKRYHCQKQADFDLCSECFSSGKFGSYMSPSDFILMEPAEAAGATGGKWTDQETLLLLEALELYKENWSEIAEHVATKTKSQCILHFVQMPIEDTFLDCDDETDATSLIGSADPVSTADDASAPNDEPETVGNKDGATNDNQPSPSPVEISKQDTGELNISPENGDCCVLKALKEAFEAVGYFPSPEEKLSFSEVGNPVMALAAFLVRLAEPNVVTAAAHSSLKAMSASDSSVQLAARHCFLLEDPPDDKKSANSERVVEMIEEEGLKDNQNSEKQKDENTNSFLDKSNSSNDQDNEKNKDSVTEEGPLVSSKDECTSKSNAAKKSAESDNHDLVKEQAPSTAEESNVIVSNAELPPSSAKESGDGGSLRPSQSTEAPKDDEIVSDSHPSEKKEPEQPIASDSVVENVANTVAEEAKDTQDSSETKHDFNIDKMKRAAITAISAAAVKAKLLATQEEDQIRELATSLIEKQLHKLETKLSFFNEMENVVMRAREQLERSKQKLFHERSQIIAARLGMSASSARPMQQQSLPVNRAATAFAHSALRPPMGMMTSQRPPISRPVMASTAGPPSSLFVPATVGGNSIPPSNQDNTSSVAMK